MSVADRTIDTLLTDFLHSFLHHASSLLRRLLPRYPLFQMAAPAAGSSQAHLLPIPTDSEVAPLPHGCITASSNGSVNLETTASQLEEVRQAARLALTGGVSHPTAHRMSSVDGLVQLLLEATPLPMELALIISEYRLLHSHTPLWVSPMVGPRHWDSKQFSTFDADQGNPLAAVLRDGWTVRDVIGHGGNYANGVQFVYGPAHPVDSANLSYWQLSALNQFIVSREASGNHHQPTRTVFNLSEDEYITRLVYHVGQFADQVQFHTTLGRMFAVGRSAGGTRYEITAPEGSALVGLNGLVGGHLHGLSAIFASHQRHRRLTAAELQGVAASPAPESPSDDDEEQKEFLSGNAGDQVVEAEMIEGLDEGDADDA